MEDKLKEQLEALMSPNPSKKKQALHYTHIILSVFVMLAGIYGVYMGAKTRLSFEIMVIFIACGVFTSTMGLANVISLLRSISKNTINPRNYDKNGLVMAGGFVLLLYFFYFQFALLKFNAKELIYFGNGLSLLATFVIIATLWQTNIWNKEELLLGQKQLQLEIALLREEIKKQMAPGKE